MIENGKITYPVKGATLIGNGPDALNRVSMIGNDMRARLRRRRVRQGRPERAGRRRPADAAHRRPDGRRHRLTASRTLRWHAPSHRERVCPGSARAFAHFGRFVRAGAGGLHRGGAPVVVPGGDARTSPPARPGRDAGRPRTLAPARSDILFRGAPLGQVDGAAGLVKLSVQDDADYVLVDASMPDPQCRHRFVMLRVGPGDEATMSAPFGDCLTAFGARRAGDRLVIQLAQEDAGHERPGHERRGTSARGTSAPDNRSATRSCTNSCGCPVT